MPVSALLPDEMEGEYDVIFLMTKQRANKEILQFLLPHLKSDGIVCTTQNGLPEPSVAAVVGEERCCGCAVSWGATFVGGGEAKLTTRPDGWNSPSARCIITAKSWARFSRCCRVWERLP